MLPKRTILLIGRKPKSSIDSNPFTRKVREAIQIRKRGTKALNRDDGLHSLDHVYNPLLFRTQLPGNDATTSGANIRGKSSGKHL